MIHKQDQKKYNEEVARVQREAYLCLSPDRMRAEISWYQSERGFATALLENTHLVSEPAKIAGIRKALKQRQEEDNRFIFDLVQLLR